MSKASEQAYAAIRRGILSGHFPAGQFVPEDEFAQYCGMSRTPVREAIAQLVAEMLLQRSDTNRVFVPIWSDDDDEELFTLRAYLESHCAQRAARSSLRSKSPSSKNITSSSSARSTAHPVPA
ncbi:GntR family transcriptional regulator [Rhizorhabdus histidinilytica]